ncbi:BCD family MFS transporter [bacterium]|nr:BCD family MFS transporter [bacterium]
MAQAFGNGTASIAGGALHTGLIESGLLTPSAAYFAIFSVEALGMAVAGVLMWHLSVTRFLSLHQVSISRRDALRAMEAGVSV